MNNINHSKMYTPTLRLSITKQCNGLCPFCHKEGQNIQCSQNYMSLDFVTDSVIPAIKGIGISKVILTGGEPTLHKDLSRIAHSIRTGCPDISIGMTTNGENTDRISEVIDCLDKITISLSSYRPEVYMKYTKVDPYPLISFINDCHPKSKAASIVITEDSIQDMFQLLDYLINQEFDVKLQFVIGKTLINRQQQYEFYRELCTHFGDSQIVLASTPSFIWNVTDNSTIRLKTPSLNRFVYDNIVRRKACLNCALKKECVERGCAVRVYTNGDVSPCLSNHILYQDIALINSIKKAYDDMEIV